MEKIQPEEEDEDEDEEYLRPRRPPGDALRGGDLDDLLGDLPRGDLEYFFLRVNYDKDQ